MKYIQNRTPGIFSSVQISLRSMASWCVEQLRTILAADKGVIMRFYIFNKVNKSLYRAPGQA
jgi:hypothetical protein